MHLNRFMSPGIQYISWNQSALLLELDIINYLQLKRTMSHIFSLKQSMWSLAKCTVFNPCCLFPTMRLCKSSMRTIWLIYRCSSWYSAFFNPMKIMFFTFLTFLHVSTGILMSDLCWSFRLEGHFEPNFSSGLVEPLQNVNITSSKEILFYVEIKRL